MLQVNNMEKNKVVLINGTVWCCKEDGISYDEVPIVYRKVGGLWCYREESCIPCMRWYASKNMTEDLDHAWAALKWSACPEIGGHGTEIAGIVARLSAIRRPRFICPWEVDTRGRITAKAIDDNGQIEVYTETTGFIVSARIRVTAERARTLAHYMSDIEDLLDEHNEVLFPAGPVDLDSRPEMKS